MLMKFKGIRVLGGVAGCWVSLSIVFLMELVYLHSTATNIPSKTCVCDWLFMIYSFILVPALRVQDGKGKRVCRVLRVLY